MAKFVAIYGLIALTAMLVACVLAVIKKRDWSYWMTITLLFPPVLILLLVMPKNPGPRPRREGLDEQEHRELTRDDNDRMF
jgi:4-amino-4-deoxy-L-arabinose transferase-like glycosyltransferase